MAALRSAANHSATLARLAQLCRSTEDGGRRSAIGTGHESLDAQLPRGGWPLGCLIEVLSDGSGLGELSLFLPALSRLARDGRQVVWIAPPYLPYAPALAHEHLPLERVLILRTRTLQETLWAAEQALRCPAVGAVLAWPAHLVDKQLRRLQLAAEAGGGLGLLHRPAAVAAESSPAALRLRLQAQEGLALHILKARGGRAGYTWRWRDTHALVLHSFARAGA